MFVEFLTTCVLSVGHEIESLEQSIAAEARDTDHDQDRIMWQDDLVVPHRSAKNIQRRVVWVGTGSQSESSWCAERQGDDRRVRS